MAPKKKPTIDERLEALNERLRKHLEERDAKLARIDERLDAVADSLELVALMQGATERQIERIEKQIERFVVFAQAIIDHHDKRITALEKRG